MINENNNEQVDAAMRTLKNFIRELSINAELGEEYAAGLWERIRQSKGVLTEVSYFHDYGDFWGQYKVAGYTLPDIVVWQVDHFKAYMDRHQEMNRYRRERLFLESIDVMLKMEDDPTPYVNKMTNETGTDFQGKY